MSAVKKKKKEKKSKGRNFYFKDDNFLNDHD